jgi:dTDP-4-dehydrorhamnose reductase
MVLLTGSTGYIGQAFQRFFTARCLPCQTLSLTRSTKVKEDLSGAIQRSGAVFLINAAGFTGKPNVDAAEKMKGACLYGNVSLPLMMAEVCADLKLPWGHVSSGCLYQGSRPDGSGFSEEDLPNFDFRHNNCSFYSGCKALAEEVLRESSDCYLWRPRIPFNEVDSPRNYLSKIMHYERLLEVRNSVTHLDEFVRACYECWFLRVPYGIYNMTNPGDITTSDVVEMVRRHRLEPNRKFSFFSNEKEFMSQAGHAPRSSCVLNSSKLAATGIRMTEVHQALTLSLTNWTSAR